MQPAADVIFTNRVEPELYVVVAQSAAWADWKLIKLLDRNKARVSAITLNFFIAIV